MATATYTVVPKSDLVIQPPEKETLIEEHEVAVDDGSPRPAWKLTLQLAVAAAAAVLLVNLVLTLYFAISYGVHAGTSILYTGDCAETAKLSTWSHIGINILGTILLSASNNAQQYLMAPTRMEVDQAHASKEWLDIGIPSIRNLFSSRIATKRRALWWFLAVGSVPLHWLYNSALFNSLSAKEYSVLVVSPDFINSTTPGFIDPARHVWNDLDVRATNDSVANLRNVMNSFERLTPVDCIAAYAQQVVSARRDVVIVVDAPSYDVTYCSDADGPTTCWYSNPNATNSVLQAYSSEYGNWVYGSTSYDWICNADSSQQCSLPSTIDAIKTNWTLDRDYPVTYCLSEQVDEQCTFRLSIPIMTIVIIFNALKLIGLVLALTAVRELPLATIGDAIVSFMQRHDPHTLDMALVPKGDFRRKEKWVPTLREYTKKNLRYCSSASVWKWLVCNLLYAAGIGTIAGLIGLAVASIREAVEYAPMSFWSLVRMDGFGKVVSRNLLSLTSSFVSSVLLANLPQLILSAIYLTYNALATGMSATREYTSYSVANFTRRSTTVASSLRVSFVTAGSTQRRAYYLQLPFRYAIPLMVGSTVLHWLTSQSLFLAKVDIFHSLNAHTADETQVLDGEASVDTCGYSVLPMICALAIASVMTLLLNVIGLVKVKGGMPIAGSCSAAIAAACHGRGTGLGPVTWGVIDEDGGTEFDHKSSSYSPERNSEKLGFVDGLARRPTPSSLYS